MTLLTTEIVTGPFQAIVFAADRRISLGGRRHTERRKILPVPRKRAGVGYFGLAELPLQGPRRHMDVWLGEFLQANSHRANLGDLGDALAQELNRLVPGQTRRSQMSGFHLSGFNDRAQPEFWFVRNIDDQFRIVGQFAAREDYQRRDRPLLPMGAIQIYRNGDIRAHAAVWEGIDESFGALLRLPDFRVGTGPVAYAGWVRFKLETIAHFYQRFCNTSILGKPVDAFVVTPTGVRWATGTRA